MTDSDQIDLNSPDLKPKKRCPDCQEFKPLSQYYSNAQRKHLDHKGTYCKPCAKVRMRKWYENLPDRKAKKRAYRLKYLDKSKQYDRTKRENLKREFLEAYGGVCTCCGEDNPKFLSLEHVKRDGAAHRKQLQPGVRRGGSTTWVLRDLKKKGWPKDGYTILCFNCNFGAWINGICPHKTEERYGTGRPKLVKSA